MCTFYLLLEMAMAPDSLIIPFFLAAGKYCGGERERETDIRVSHTHSFFLHDSILNSSFNIKWNLGWTSEKQQNLLNGKSHSSQ